MRGARGQAAIELLAVLPLLLLVVTAGGQLLSAGVCRELAAGAAHAGARALLEDRDPRTAARRALPGWSSRRAAVSVTGRVVRVSIRPPAVLPGLARLLRAERRADAGPAA